MKLSSLLLLSAAFITQYTKSDELRNPNNVVKDSNSNHNPSNIKVIEETIEKSSLDTSEYKIIQLPNGIEVVLVSDPSVVLAATSVAVRAGSKDDPKEFPGLAHLCEYMLFAGTERYPKEDEYSSFILDHGGSFDSYTGLERTVFISEIDSKYHYEQLNRMSDFFVKPLFTEDSIERETYFINLEFQRYRHNFVRAKYNLLNYILKDTGLFPEFGAGNRQTLFSNPRANNNSVKEALNDFFNKFYTSHDIKLAVYGNESLDTLQEWVQMTFGRVPSKKGRELNLTNPFKNITKYHYWYNFTGSPYSLDLVFVIPSSGVHHKSLPLQYLDYLFSYKGPNSSVEYLTEKNIASDFQISTQPYSSKYDLLFISFDLLFRGRYFYEDVIKEFFNCLQFFKENGPNKEIFQEIMKAQQFEFKYSFKESPFKHVETLSTAMLFDSLPRKYLLKEDYIKEYNEDEFKEFFSALSPDNFISLGNSIKRAYNETDPYYGSAYIKQYYKAGFIQSLTNLSVPELKYPPKNIYITEEEVAMKKIDVLIKPDLLKNTSLSTLWYKYGSSFYCPYGVIRILLRNSYTTSTPTNFLKMKFLQSYIYRSIPFDFLQLDIANINFRIIPSRPGLSLVFYGHAAKIMELVSKVITTLKEINLVYEKFESIKTSVIYYFMRMSSTEPSSFLESDMDNILLPERQFPKNMILLLQGLQHSEVNAYFYNLLSNVHFDILVTGNIPEEDALHILDMLETQIAPHLLTPSQYINGRVVTLENGSDYLRIHDILRPDMKSGLFMYFEATETINFKKAALLFILYIILRAPIYHELRTNERLGYILRSGVKITRTIMGYYILIQGERQPHVLHSRVDAFLTKMLDKILKITPEEFSYYSGNAQRFLGRKSLNIVSESANIWNDIIEGTYTFELDSESHKIDHIEYHELVDLFKEVFYNTKKRFSYHLGSAVENDIYNLLDIPLDKLSEFLTTKGENISEEKLREIVLLSHDISSFQINLFRHIAEDIIKLVNQDKEEDKSKDKDKSKEKGEKEKSEKEKQEEKERKKKRRENLEKYNFKVRQVEEALDYLQKLYLSEKTEILKSLDVVDDLSYFKANSSLSSAFIHVSLWDKFYR